MPKFQMTYPYGRLYPTSLGLVASGGIIEADENPDPNHFTEVTEDSSASVSQAPRSGRKSPKAANGESEASPEPDPENTDIHTTEEVTE